MSRKSSEHCRSEPTVLSPPVPISRLALFGLVLFVLALDVYGGSIPGPFVFDDLGLPFYSRDFAAQPLLAWISGVRPLLMLSYWMNFQTSEYGSSAYHITNVLLHTLNALLVGLILRRVLPGETLGPTRSLTVASIGAMLFLLHPLATEAVAYIAGRSELLCAFFILLALTVFLHQSPERISWRSCWVILGLYGCAVMSKEQAVVLPALLIATDACLNRRSVAALLKAHSRLYILLAAASAAGLVAVWSVISVSKTAGFQVAGLSSSDYFWTQCRVWFLYLKTFVLPFSLNADYDIAVSHGPFEHGALLGLLAMLAAAVAAWRFRREYPLAAWGFAVFVILLAPTSTIVPLQDLVAERRMYLPLLGLMIVLLQFLLRLRLGGRELAGAASVLLLFGALTHARSGVWGDDVLLWSDVIAKSPAKSRGYTHLVFAYVRSGRCTEALTRINDFPEMPRETADFLGAWGAAYECAHQPEEALERYKRAAAVAPGVGTYLKLAMAHQRQGQMRDANLVANQALRMQPKTPFDRAALEAYNSLEQSRSRSVVVH